MWECEGRRDGRKERDDTRRDQDHDQDQVAYIQLTRRKGLSKVDQALDGQSSE